MIEKGGRLVVGTERAVKMSPEEGVDGQGDEALPCWQALASASKHDT